MKTPRFIHPFRRSGLKVICCLACLCLSIGLLPAERPQRTKEDLCKLATLPPLMYSFGVHFSWEGLLFWDRDHLEISEEIASLKKDLHGNSSDASRLYQIGVLLDTIGNSNAAATFTNSIKAFREEIEKRPQDARLLCDFGRTLAKGGRQVEAQSVLRRAVKMSPEEPEAWASLGVFLNNLAYWELLYADPGKPVSTNSPGAATQPDAWLHPTPERLERAITCNKEAMECLDHAASITTNDPSIYERRAYCTTMTVLIRKLKKEPDGPQNDTLSATNAAATWSLTQFSPECLADLDHAARLDRKNPRRLGAVAFFEAVSDSAKSTGRPAAAPGTFSDSLSEETKKSIHWKLDELAGLSESPNEKTAADAAEVLGLLEYAIMKESSQAEASYLRATKLNPKDERAWDGLIVMMMTAKRHEQALQVAHERLKANPTARAHLVAAKVYQGLDQWDKVVDETRAAMKLAPDEALFKVAFWSAAIHAGNDDLIREATGAFKPKENYEEFSYEQVTHFHFISGLHWAFFGNVQPARREFNAVLQHDPRHEGARKALEIISGWNDESHQFSSPPADSMADGHE